MMYASQAHGAYLWITTNIHKVTYGVIIGIVVLAAVFEWILWLIAFLYCFAKVIQKAEGLTARICAGFMMVVFTIVR